MIKRKYTTRKTCKHYKSDNFFGRECFAKLSTWKCNGITYCEKKHGWYRPILPF